MKDQVMWPIVWLVDDCEVDLMLASRVLSRSGMAGDVLCHEGGHEAWAAWQQCQAGSVPRPSLIFLDINMPGMGGFEFLERFQRPGRLPATGEVPEGPVPVVMLSSSPEPSDEQRALRFDCVLDYLVKPLTVPTLAQLARHWGLSNEIDPSGPDGLT